MKRISVLGLLLISIATPTLLQAQNKGQDDIKRIVEARDFIFKADRVNPHGSISRQLTSAMLIRKLTTLRCVISTPLGCPVEPEV